MDPVTSAIIAAITAGALGGMTEASKNMISDAYERLKKIMKKRFGNKSEVVQAIKTLEKKPDSAGRKETLKEEIVLLGADKDSEILGAAQKILELLNNYSDLKHVQSATGNFIAQADRHSTANVKVMNPKNSHVR